VTPKMLLRKIVIYLLFLILPIVSIFIYAFGDDFNLSSFGLISVALSLVFIAAFSFRKKIVSKMLLALLLLSLLGQEISSQLTAADLTFSTSLLLIIAMLYKTALAFIIYHYLISPFYSSQTNEI